MSITKEFEFETSTGEILDVSVDIDCRDGDYCDASFDRVYLARRAKPYDAVKESSLSDADQGRLERRCQECADQYAGDAYQSYAEGAADFAYDRWKDEQSERGD